METKEKIFIKRRNMSDLDLAIDNILKDADEGTISRSVLAGQIKALIELAVKSNKLYLCKTCGCQMLNVCLPCSRAK